MSFDVYIAEVNADVFFSHSPALELRAPGATSRVQSSGRFVRLRKMI